MGMHDEVELHLCPNCFQPSNSAGECPDCGVARISCRPGDPDDPCRRPVMDREGLIKSRAPLWWLQYSVQNLAGHLQEQDER